VILRTLGGLRIDGAPLRRSKPMLLLAYLSLEGRQPRDRLTRLFWPSAADPRNRLSVALHRIQAGAPGAVAADEQAAWARIRCDVHGLRAAIEEGEADVAARLYAGAFLEGVRIQHLGPEAEAWLVDTREALAASLQALFARTVLRSLADRRREPAARFATRLATVAGAPVPERRTLERWHTLAVASGAEEAAARMRADAEGLDLDLAGSESEARARLLVETPPLRVPRPPTSFVGRARERVELARFVGHPDHPLVTLHGPGGVGKTRLALALAHDGWAAGTFPGGVYFVPLVALDDASEIPSAVAEALGVAVRRGETAFEAVVRALGPTRTLLVLDNVDAWVDGADVIARWIAARPSLSVLATSQERLDLEEESVFPVDGLALPTGRDGDDGHDDGASDAVHLFIDRARRARLDFAPDAADLRAIARLCRTLGGVPLAIELAAAAVRDAHPDEILTAVGQNLEVLRTSSRTRPERHLTLRAAVDDAWRRAPDAEREGLVGLARFRGGFDSAAALAVAGVDADLLDRLEGRSLVRPVDERYELHPWIASYARGTRPGDDPAVDAWRERHARYYAKVARRASEAYGGSEHARAQALLDADAGNVAMAHAWAWANDPHLALELVGSRHRHWLSTGRFAEGRAAAERALAKAPDGRVEDRVAARLAAGRLALRQGDVEAAREHATVARDEALQADLGRALAAAWQLLGDAAEDAYDLDRARTCFAEAERASQRARDEIGQLIALDAEGRVAARSGEMERARDCFTRTSALAERRGAPSRAAVAHFNLGAVARDLGELDDADEHFARAAELSGTIGDRARLLAARFERAALARARGDDARAGRLYREVRRTAAAMDDVRTLARVAGELGVLAYRASDLDEAARRQAEALELWLRCGQTWRTGPALWGLARIADASGHPKIAALLWGAEAAVAERAQRTRPPVEAEAHRRDVAETRARLSDAAFEAAYRIGAGLTPADVARAPIADEGPAALVPLLDAPARSTGSKRR
jgi:predicted ATPase